MKKIDYYEICNSKLKYLKYSDNTVRIYSFYINEFLNSIKEPSRLTSKDFQLYLNNYVFSSISQQNQIISSIKFLYKFGLRKKFNKVDFTRPRKEKKLPKVIEHDFLIKQINNIKNLKHKAIISLAYSTGLRVSEILTLKISDIDSNRMIVIVINGKCKKDRIVPLSERMLKLLRVYFLKFRPKEYLFNGQNSPKYSRTSCNKIVKKYLYEKYHMHMLRHSFFTYLLECGVNLRIIQSIAGHSSSKTTEIYTHVSKNVLNNIKLPI